MDFPELPAELHEAGRDYYSQLTQLGLHPEALLWVRDVEEARFVLWLVWSGIDKFGPLALTKLLFDAYRASALTQKIDPFLVEVHSPKEKRMVNLMAAVTDADFEDLTEVSMGQGAIVLSGPVQLQTKGSWVYHAQKKKRASLDVSRDWRRFSQQVNAVAA